MRVMSLRGFLRGGYQRIYEPTVITKKGIVVFSVWPGSSNRSAGVLESRQVQPDSARMAGDNPLSDRP